MVSPTRQCAAVCGIIRQRIFVSTPNRCIAACAISPGLSPCHFFLIPTTKTTIDRPLLCGHASHSDGRDKSALSIPESVILDCFKGLQKSWKPCIHAEGSYFKKRSLASECNYTVLIFILSVSELSGTSLHSKLIAISYECHFAGPSGRAV